MSLKVKIYSFSYLQGGIPKDNSGHGGGFVFDCRAIFNPGRQTEFKNLCGKDKEVCEFLESQSGMNDFLKNVYALVDPAIENYLERNFESLMVSFGCTGGQHRSVYAAEKLKDHIHEKFPGVETEIYHNEWDKKLLKKSDEKLKA